MAHDYRTERVEPAWRVQEFAHHGHDGQRRHPSHAYEKAAQPTPHPTAEDVASVLGLPASAVSPELLDTLVPLLAEIDRLHWHADQAERRVAWLERQADRHSVVPCLTRRALVRELDSFLAGGDAHGVVALVSVAGIEALRQNQGLVAGEGALRHICANILGALRNTDVVGCLGGSDFAVLLPGADRANAEAKLAEIRSRIVEPNFIWQGQTVPLWPSYGLHVVEAGDGAEQALAAADRDRRGLD